MTWTGRPDGEPCCGDEPGSVACEEDVARLIHSRIEDPDVLAFTRKDLTGQGIDRPSNICGAADGCSVDRATGLGDDELRRRAELQAAKREGRTARGAWIANVAALRAIRHPGAPEGAVRVYDDPMPDNDRHAVIRVSPDIPRTDFNEVRRAIIAAFGRRVA